MRLSSVAALCAAVACARSTAAQQMRASIDAGSSNVRYADSISSTAFALSPALQLQGRRAWAAVNGTLTQSSGASTFSGMLLGSLTVVERGALSAELGGSAGGSSHSDGSSTSQLLGTTRLYVTRARGGGWVGAGAGSTNDGSRSFGVVQGSVGGWRSGDAGSAVVSLTPTAVDDTIRYADAVITLLRDVGRWELSANVGTRIGDPLPTLVTDRVWGSVSVTSWLRPNVGLVAGAGTYPIDFTQGFPGGRFLTLSVRLAATRRAEPIASDAATAAPAADVAEGFSVQRVSGSTHRVRVHAPTARSVELSGDFTRWSAVRMTAESGGWWSVDLPIVAGTHEVELRIDGARVAPPGLTPLRDEFGGVTGLLVIR